MTGVGAKAKQHHALPALTLDGELDDERVDEHGEAEEDVDGHEKPHHAHLGGRGRGRRCMEASATPLAPRLAALRARPQRHCEGFTRAPPCPTTAGPPARQLT